ncbi:MAG TPA: M13 family peptidase, partial [Chitinophagaceae bacterium]|nr:M13 family peptidase [Chitinophagaceae bacterium]
MIKQLFACTLLATVVVSCNNKTETTEVKKDILFSDLDTTVNPSSDFFDYANGGWIKKNPIPNEQSSWGIGNLVYEENLRRTREISEEAARSGAAKGSNEQKIGDFWSSGMD